LTDIYQILTRYSSRGRTGESIEGKDIFSYPLEILSWSDLYDHCDNFDYVSNLFKFFTGEVQTKAIFSAAPASGIIAAYILNGLTSTMTGDYLKAGNSMAITHQAVWPELDVTFPYMCEVPYNGIAARDMTDMFSIAYNEGTTISKFLISAAPNFKLYYLMPVPTWFFTSRPVLDGSQGEKEVDSDFQSSSGNTTAVMTCSFEADGTMNNQAFELPFGFPISQNSDYYVELSGYMVRSLGTDDSTAFVIFLDRGDPGNFPSGAISEDTSETGLQMGIVSWYDATGDGTYISQFKLTQTNYSQEANKYTFDWISIWPIGVPPSDMSKWSFTFSLKVKPASNLIAITEVLGLYPLVVAVDNTDWPALHVVVDNEIVATIDNVDPLPVIISNPEPVPVVVEGDIPISGDITISAATTQTTPLWTTMYGPIGP